MEVNVTAIHFCHFCFKQSLFFFLSQCIERYKQLCFDGLQKLHKSLKRSGTERDKMDKLHLQGHPHLVYSGVAAGPKSS